MCRSLSFYQRTQKDGFALSPVGFDGYKNLPPYTALKAAYQRKQFWIVADTRVGPSLTTYYKHLRKLGGRVSVDLEDEDEDEEDVDEEIHDGLFECHRCGSSLPKEIMDVHLEVCQVRYHFSPNILRVALTKDACNCQMPAPKRKLPSLPSDDDSGTEDDRNSDSQKSDDSAETASTTTTDLGTRTKAAPRQKSNQATKTASSSRPKPKHKNKKTSNAKGKAPVRPKPKGFKKPSVQPPKKKPRNQTIVSPSPSLSLESEDPVAVGPSRSAKAKAGPSIPKGKVSVSASWTSTLEPTVQPTAGSSSAALAGPSIAVVGPSGGYQATDETYDGSQSLLTATEEVMGGEPAVLGAGDTSVPSLHLIARPKRTTRVPPPFPAPIVPISNNSRQNKP